MSIPMRDPGFEYPRGNVVAPKAIKAVEGRGVVVLRDKPTVDMDEGVYKVIRDGLFFGHYNVVKTWTGEKAVIYWPLYLVEGGCL